VRIEDLDPARVIPGCADQMLRTLESFGLTWDGTVEYQSRATAYYRHALSQLVSAGLTYPCSCSRAQSQGAGGYPGTCRNGPTRPGATATRLRMPEGAVSFEDRVQGPCRFELGERGDVIVRRRDGAFAYQMAVVVDDARQAVTDVVRGGDLLDSTPWQITLQQALGLPPLRYAHLPLVTEPSGEKLAKARRSVALDPARAGLLLYEALELLGQHPTAELKAEPVATLLDWGQRHWNLAGIRGVRQVRAAV
jgi:glutamyl-Q tRNA(Asp) synthetase